MKMIDTFLWVLLCIGLVLMFVTFANYPDGLNVAGLEFIGPKNNGILYIVVGIVLFLKLISSFIKKTNEIHDKFFERI